jgi:hypothetical protein
MIVEIKLERTFLLSPPLRTPAILGGGFFCFGICAIITIIRMEAIMLEKRIFRYLKNKPNGTASSLEIIKDLSLKTTDEGFNSIIENLYLRDLILMPHKQIDLYSDLKYDLITISKTGRKLVQT